MDWQLKVELRIIHSKFSKFEKFVRNRIADEKHNSNDIRKKQFNI